jgi:Protein of unknown function DUF45
MGWTYAGDSTIGLDLLLVTALAFERAPWPPRALKSLIALTQMPLELSTPRTQGCPPCLEYVLVHEMVHFLERRHSQRFRELMDALMPRWRFYREELNRVPLAHEEWTY